MCKRYYIDIKEREGELETNSSKQAQKERKNLQIVDVNLAFRHGKLNVASMIVDTLAIADHKQTFLEVTSRRAQLVNV